MPPPFGPMSGSGAGPGASSPLDGPPPSPQAMGAGPGGQATPFSLASMAPGSPLGAGAMPPEILAGILQSADRINSLLDSYAQVAPDLAMDFALIKNQIATTLAKLVERGATPTSPTATGPQYPAGGFDQGVSGAGAV